jgi:hypothetical protein
MRASIVITPISNGMFDHDVYVYANGDQIVHEDSFLSANDATVYAVDHTPNVTVRKNTKAKDFVAGATDREVTRVKTLVRDYKTIKSRMS